MLPLLVAEEYWLSTPIPLSTFRWYFVPFLFLEQIRLERVTWYLSAHFESDTLYHYPPTSIPDHNVRLDTSSLLAKCHQ